MVRCKECCRIFCELYRGDYKAGEFYDADELAELEPDYFELVREECAPIIDEDKPLKTKGKGGK